MALDEIGDAIDVIIDNALEIGQLLYFVKKPLTKTPCVPCAYILELTFH